MRLRIAFLFVIAACAHALPSGDDDASIGGKDASIQDAKTSDVAADGKTGSCDPSQTKCTEPDGGSVCADIKTDVDHCGTCTTACTTADAGSLQPGPNNPDAGIPFDGGYDGGIGWSLGAPACDGGACAIDCPQGLTECGDGICYDTQNFHDHCGNCSTACQSTEWCTQGHCCSQGTAYCGGSCVDVNSDKNNCGACGNTCSGGTPVCSGGKCTSADVFSQSFTQGQIATNQCTVWTSFRASLTGTYSSITISGSNDTTGRTCTGSGANTLCQALHSGTATNVLCNGHTWYIDDCSGLEITADDKACTCQTPGYAVRPCLYENGDWGGVNTATCSGPTQTMTVTCQ